LLLSIHIIGEKGEKFKPDLVRNWSEFGGLCLLLKTHERARLTRPKGDHKGVSRPTAWLSGRRKWLANARPSDMTVEAIKAVRNRKQYNSLPYCRGRGRGGLF